MKSTNDFLYSSTKDSVLSEKLVSARKRGKFCDVELATSDHAVLAHRAVLASFSQSFEDLLGNIDAGCCVKFQRYSHSTLESLIDYIYTGKLHVNKSSVGDIALLAAELGLGDLLSACLVELSNDIENDTFGTLAFAKKHSFAQLVDASERYIRDNFSTVQQTKQFLQLPRLQVELFTSKQHANLVAANDDEFLMLQIVEWVRRRLQVHGEKLQGLLEESRMVYLQTDHYLKDVMMEECSEVIDLNSSDRQEMFKRMTSRDKNEIHNNNNRDLVEAQKPMGQYKLLACTQTSEQSYVGLALLDGRVIAINLHHKSNKTRSTRGSVSSDSSSSEEAANSGQMTMTMLSPMALGKCSMGVVCLLDKVYVIGGYNRGNCIHAVECYDSDVNDWMSVAPLPSARARLCSVSLDNKLFALGGSDGHSILNSVDVYDPTTDTWMMGEPMLGCRSSFGAAVFNGDIYAIGGSRDSSAMKLSEVYSGVSKKWSHITPLNLPRENACVVENDGLIYAIGGSHGWTCHNSVEVFNPTENSWSFISSLLSPRRGASAIVHQGKIVVAGGSDGRFALNSVELYDPQQDTWQSMPPMLTPRSNAGLALINNTVFVFGGFGGPSGTEFLNTVESYNEKLCDWKIHI